MEPKITLSRNVLVVSWVCQIAAAVFQNAEFAGSVPKRKTGGPP